MKLEGYLQELNIAKLVLENERIFATESQRDVLTGETSSVDEDIRQAEKSKRMLESNSDFAVSKETQQSKRAGKRLQKKGQRRREKVRICDDAVQRFSAMLADVSGPGVLIKYFPFKSPPSHPHPHTRSLHRTRTNTGQWVSWSYDAGLLLKIFASSA